MLRRDRDVVEEAEAHRAAGRRVVARAGDAATHATAAAPAEQRVDHRDRPARRMQRGLPRARADGRVHVDHPAPAGRERLDAIDVGGRVHGLDRRTRRRRRQAHVPPQPVALAERTLDRDDPPRRLGMRTGLVLERRRMAQQDSAGHPGYRTCQRGRRTAAHHRRRGRRGRRRRPVRRAVRGAAPGRGSRSSPRRRSRRPRATGRRAGSPRRSRSTTTPSDHLHDTETAGRNAVRRSAAEVLVDEAPGLRRRPRAPRRALRRRPSRQPQRSASRAATRAGASCTPAAARPAGASCASSRPWPSTAGASRSSRVRARPAPGCEDGRCVGVLLEDGRAIRARATILATGGAAALWSRTTNPPGSLGIGMALAHAAGADLADLEFLQFHPTAVKGIKGREGFLVTEAIRGEGATLHGPDGARFVDELAPRDEVARAIDAVMRETGERLGRPGHARRRPGALPERRRRAARRAAWTRRRSRSPSPPRRIT